jgi:Mn-dependent DtxR family transcriptional regulator
MVKKNSFYSLQEREIIRILYREMRPLSFNELAEMADLSWATTKKYVEKLKKKGVVKVYYLPKMKKPKAEFNFDLVERIFAI